MNDYANDDVYFLELCIYSQVCRNGAQLFQLGQYEDFVCDYAPEKLEALRTLLVAGPAPDPIRFP